MDQTNGQGQILGDEDESIDPVDTGPGGALNTIATKSDAKQRVVNGREAMNNLQSQYANDQAQQAEAFTQQRKTLESATQRLLGLQYGPTEQEEQYLSASVPGEASTGRYDPGAHNKMHADLLAARRNGEIEKNKLIASYATQIPATMLAQAGASANQHLAMMRVQQTANTSAENAVEKLAAAAPKVNGTSTWDAQGGPNGTGAWTSDATLQKDRQDASALKLKNSLAIKAATQKLNGGQMDDQTIDFLADAWLKDKGALSGLTRSGMLPTIMSRAQQHATANGDNANAVIADRQFTQARQGVLKDYESSKGTGGEIKAANTAVQHLNTLKPLIEQLNNGDNSWVNSIQNTWNQKVMGKPAPTDFNGVRDFVAGEIAKAVLPGGGGEAERQALAASASSANSPQALRSIAQKWQELLAGKLQYTKQNWIMSTKDKDGSMPFGNFEDRFLLPDTQKAMGMHAAPAAPAARPGQASAVSAARRAELMKLYAPQATP